jgi:hypothetical protein
MVIKIMHEKFIINFNTIRYLALNESENKIYRTCKKSKTVNNIFIINNIFKKINILLFRWKK